MRIITRLSILLALTLCAANTQALEVSGRVLDPSGAPVEGATITLASFLKLEERAERIQHGHLTYDEQASTTTDEFGRYRLEAPGPGLYGLLVEAPGHRPLLSIVAPLVRPTVIPDAHPKPAKSLRVNVVDADGQAIENARLMLFARPSRNDHERGWRLHTSRAFTDENGTATLIGGEGERWWLTVMADGFAHDISKIDGGEARITLGAGSKRRLRFIDERGRPVQAMVLHRLEPMGRAGKDGLLELLLPDSIPNRGLTFRAYSGELEASYIAHATSHESPGEDPRQDGGDAGDPEIDDETETEIEVEMSYVPEWTGSVHDRETDLPIADALVFSPRRLTRMVRTDGQGRFTIALEPRGHIGHELIAAAPGYALSGLDHLKSGDGLSYRLAPTSEVYGRVLSPQGEPVEGATIRVIEPLTRIDYSSGRKSTHSSAGGLFSIAAPASSAYALRASAPGFGSRQVEPEGNAGHPEAPIDIHLDHFRSAFGLAVDQEGKPLAGVKATLQHNSQSGHWGEWPPPEPIEVTTGGDGRFTFEEIGVGLFHLSLSAPGKPPFENPHLEIAGDPLDTDLGRFELTDGVELTGRVLGDGEPLEGVSVSTARHSGYSASQSEPGLTDSEGRFEIEGLVEGQPVQLSLHKEGWSARSIQLEVSDEDLELEMTRTTAVEGRVTDSMGDPIPQASVQFGNGSYFEGTTTNIDGRFQYELTPGRYTLKAHANGFRPYARNDVEIGASSVSQAAGRGTAGKQKAREEPFANLSFEITLERGLELRGTVFGPGGEPQSDAELHVSTGLHSYAHDRTGADGRFTLSGLEPGTVHVFVGHEKLGTLNEVVELRAQSVDADFRFPTGVSVTGVVVEEASGAPISGASLILTTQTPGGVSRQARALRDGTFLLEHITPGRYTLQVRHANFAPSNPREFDVASTPIGDLRFELGNGAEVVGRISGLAPEEILLIRLQSQQEFRHTTVDSEGVFRFLHLNPGDWLIAGEGKEGRKASQRISIPPHVDQVEVELAFDDATGFTITGEVHLHGEPMAGMMVVVQAIGFSDAHSVVTDHRGRFKIHVNREGRHQVKLWRDGQSWLNQEVRITGDDHWSLEARGSRVEGRVVDANGRTVSGARVQLRHLEDGDHSSHFLMATSDGLGAFALDGVQEGPYKLMASKDGYAIFAEPFHVDGAGLSGLEVVLEPEGGVVLHPRRPDGTWPDKIDIATLDATGFKQGTRTLALDGNGSVRYSTLPSGNWLLLIAESGGAAITWSVESPGDGGSPVLPTSGRLILSAPELMADGTGIRLRAQDSQGQPYRGLNTGWLHSQKIEQILPTGVWRLDIEAADGQTWQREISIHADGETVITLP